jgi:hypothetical protein
MSSLLDAALSRRGKLSSRIATRSPRLARRYLLVSVVAAAGWITGLAIGQAQTMTFPSPDQGTPILRGSRGLNPQQGGITTYPLPRRHLNAVGKPCVEVGGYSRAQLQNSNIYDHLIRTENSCSQGIEIKVCYYNSTKCLQIRVPPYGRKESILGIFPAMKDFRFEFTELFN